MANKLYNYFVEAEKLGGVKARTRFSFLTQTSSLQSKSLVDSDENLELFETAFEELSKEFKTSHEAMERRTQKSCSEITIQLRKMLDGLVDLVAQRSLYIDDFKAILNRITETISYTLDIERVSIWVIKKEKGTFDCIDLFEQGKVKHSSNISLELDKYPHYFESLSTERTLPANDVINDERTVELLDYLKPLKISSMMDVPIWAKGKMIGIICHEHVGPRREWSVDEENFAYIMSNFVSLAVENLGLENIYNTNK